MKFTSDFIFLCDSSEMEVEISDDALVQVFGFLNSSEICKLSTISRKFHRVANSDSLWKRLFFAEFGTLSFGNPEDFKLAMENIQKNCGDVTWKGRFIHVYQWKKRLGHIFGFVFIGTQSPVVWTLTESVWISVPVSNPKCFLCFGCLSSDQIDIVLNQFRVSDHGSEAKTEIQCKKCNIVTFYGRVELRNYGRSGLDIWNKRIQSNWWSN